MIQRLESQVASGTVQKPSADSRGVEVVSETCVSKAQARSARRRAVSRQRRARRRPRSRDAAGAERRRASRSSQRHRRRSGRRDRERQRRSRAADRMAARRATERSARFASPTCRRRSMRWRASAKSRTCCRPSEAQPRSRRGNGRRRRADADSAVRPRPVRRRLSARRLVLEELFVFERLRRRIAVEDLELALLHPRVADERVRDRRCAAASGRAAAARRASARHRARARPSRLPTGMSTYVERIEEEIDHARRCIAHRGRAEERQRQVRTGADAPDRERLSEVFVVRFQTDGRGDIEQAGDAERAC